MTSKTKICDTLHCGEPVIGDINGKHYCEECYEGWVEYLSEQDGPDPHGDRDPPPEEQAGWAMQDKIDMYRREH